MLKYQREMARDVIDDILVLGKMHWDETEIYQSAEFNPDIKRYIAFNDSGSHQLYTARNTETDEIVGYLGVYVMPSMHTQVLIATEDNWYLHPDSRGGRNGMRMYQFVEEELKKQGVKECHMNSKFANNSASLMRFLGYEEVGTYCYKQL